MKNSTSMKACVLASYLLSSVVPMHAVVDAGTITSAANSVVSSISRTSKLAATAFLAASVYAFYSRKPDNNPDRYNLDELYAGNFDFDNLKYFYIDGIVGHPKESDKVKTDDNGNILVNKGAKERGFGGFLSEAVKPLAKTIAFAAIITSFLPTAQKGISNWEAAADYLFGE